MSAQDNSLLMIHDPEFYVPVERRPPGPEFRSVVAGILPEPAWTILPQGMWTYAQPREGSGVQHGWKLHVSTLPPNAAAVLQRVAGVLKGDPAAFKFASDARNLDLLTTKNWPRSGGGKFITIYPADDAHFQRLGHALAAATAEFDGPYILSDRAVPGSRVVFYRYGEHRASGGVNVGGERVARMQGPSGEEAVDKRTGYYQIPEWATDPYGAPPVRVLDAHARKVTLNGRYEIQGALKHSNLGGMYLANDLVEDRPVVIRERRPHYGWVSAAIDCVALLRKETEILRAMDGTGWTPGYVDSFQAWEHHYLVMEEVKAMSLRDFVAAQYFRRKKVASPRRLFATLRGLILELLRGMEEFHGRGIILRDLTPQNALVRRDRSLCFVDLEFAWNRRGEFPPVLRIQTPGFASPEQVAGEMPTEADDYYALGAVVVEMCSCMAGGLGLNQEGVLAMMEMMMDETGLPRALAEVARGLLQPDPSLRWNADAVRAALSRVRAGDIPWAAREPGRRLAAGSAGCASRETVTRSAEACEAVCAFLEASADPAQSDALWPGSPQTFATNPVSILHGACGPLEHVRRVRGACPGAWLDWVEERAAPERCPPGLYAGLAGVALTLAGCGRVEAARRLLRSAAESPLLDSSADLYHGAAGVGLAALSLGADLGDPSLRDLAVRLGDALAARAERSRHGLRWPAENGKVHSGIARGTAGISLFYTSLGACTGEARYWEIAGQALGFEFAQASMRGGYLLWPDAAGKQRSFWSPHVSFGAAGIGTAVARLYACTGNPELLEWAERCADTLTFRWTNKLWQDMGYAGYGETFLDMYALTGDPRYQEHALRIAEVLLPSQVRTRLGVAFPGLGWCRVSSDFGYGASGIALFLHRLVHGGHRAFFPDHLLPGWSAVAPASSSSLATAPVPGSRNGGEAYEAGRRRERRTLRTAA